MGWAVIFLTLLTYCTGIDGQSTWTQPPSSSVSLGETIRISCLTTQSSYRIVWNQQKVGEAPRFVHCDGCSNRGEGIPNRFTATRSGTTGSLTITNAEAGDEGIYFCVSWNNAGNAYIFGGGTEMSVSGQPTVSPSVQVFAPSQEEVRNPNPYTFVCLLTEFYPPAFELQWKVDDKVITSGVETTKASKQDGKYLASSYMKLTEAEYRDHNAVTCEVTHDSKTIAKSVSKSGSC